MTVLDLVAPMHLKGLCRTATSQRDHGTSRPATLAIDTGFVFGAPSVTSFQWQTRSTEGASDVHRWLLRLRTLT